MKGLRIGVVITGSFCTFSDIMPVIANLCNDNTVTAILSPAAATFDTRFYIADNFKDDLIKLTGMPLILDIVQAEQIGPKRLFDIMLVAPCTGNSLAKLNHGITDTAALMAMKSHIRNNRPLVIAPSTNDALGTAAVNLGGLLCRRGIYFVPYRQDDFENKPRSMIASFGLCQSAMEAALEDRQLQPIILSPE